MQLNEKALKVGRGIAANFISSYGLDYDSISGIEISSPLGEVLVKFGGLKSKFQSNLYLVKGQLHFKSSG